MNQEQKQKVIVRNALLWGGAFITPPAVMAIVDATTRETPNQNHIALFSTFVLMALFIFSNANVSRALQSVSDSGPNDANGSSERSE